MTARLVRPFPWATLPHASRAASASLLALRSAVGPRGLPARALAALSDLAGTPIALASEGAGAALHTTLASEAVTLRIAPPASTIDASAWWVVLEVEPAFVVAIVARVTRRAPPRVLAPGLPSPQVAGAFVAIVAAAMRRAGVPVTVSDVGASFAGLTAAPGASFAAFTVLAGDEASHVRAFFPTHLLASAPPRFTREGLASLGSLPLDVPVIASRTLAAAADIAALAEGDAWMLGDAWRLGRLDAPLQGPVWLSAPSHGFGLVASLEAGTRVVLRDGIEELGWSPMEEETAEGAAVAEAVGEVPVVVRVEVGSVRMKAKEWASLAPGDVVGLGAKIGSSVVLRVSGMAVAEGELVELEGEVGVRVLKRLVGGTA